MKRKAPPGGGAETSIAAELIRGFGFVVDVERDAGEGLEAVGVGIDAAAMGEAVDPHEEVFGIFTVGVRALADEFFIL